MLSQIIVIVWDNWRDQDRLINAAGLAQYCYVVHLDRNPTDRSVRPMSPVTTRRSIILSNKEMAISGCKQLTVVSKSFEQSR